MSLILSGTDGVQGNSGAIESGTAVTASGTAVDFTGIPSWAKRITVMFDAVSTSGTSNVLCRIGAGGTATTSGYLGNSVALTNGAAVVVNDSTSSLVISQVASAANNFVATAVFTNLSNNTWVGTSSCRTNATIATISNISVTLSGALDIVRIATANGTDTFDAGTINIIYE